MMPRMKSVTSIEAKIALAQEKLLAAEARYNAWAEKVACPAERKGRGAGSQHRRGSQNQPEDLSGADDLFGEIITRAGV